MSSSQMYRSAIMTLCLMTGRSTESVGEAPLARITPCTTVDLPFAASLERERWNQAILLAKPRIASGDTDRLSEAVCKSVSTLTLTILATIKKADNGNYQLVEIGVGYSVPINGKQTIISSESASQLGANLGFIAGQMLRENESRLHQVVQIGRTSNVLMFDAPAILLREAKHQDYIVRHLCWIDATTGEVATLIWLLAEDANGKTIVVDEPPRIVPAGTVEDRRIHVDGSQFLFGIPKDRAFALEGLPPGTSLSWVVPLSPLISRRSYTRQKFAELTTYLKRTMTAVNKPNAATENEAPAKAFE